MPQTKLKYTHLNDKSQTKDRMKATINLHIIPIEILNTIKSITHLSNVS